jgi:hypothetical protein
MVQGNEIIGKNKEDNMEREEKDPKVLQREEPLHNILPEEVEEMWRKFLEENKIPCEGCCYCSGEYYHYR